MISIHGKGNGGWHNGSGRTMGPTVWLFYSRFAIWAVTSILLLVQNPLDTQHI